MADGTRSSAELAAWLAAEMTAGRLTLPDPSAADVNGVHAAAELQVTDTLRHLADCAALAPAAA
jgi:hypothetical protein